MASAPTPELRPYLSAFDSVTGHADFEAALNGLVNEGMFLPGNSNKGRVRDLLVALWSSGCLVFPREPDDYLGRLHRGTIYWGETGANHCASKIVDEFLAVSNLHPKSTSIQLRKLLSLMVSFGGIQECGDLTPNVLKTRLVGWKLAPSFSSTLVAMLRAQYGAAAVGFNANDYGPFGKQSHLSDDSFQWATDRDGALEQWRALCEEWLKSQARNVRGKRNALNCQSARKVDPGSASNFDPLVERTG
jgi:hypothetical protein